jgi:hypothetical protein
MAHSNPQPAYEKVEGIIDAESFAAARVNPYTGAAVTLYRFEDTDETHIAVTEYDSNI